MDWSISSAAVAADGDLACLSTRAEASLLVQTHLCAWARFWISKPLCVSLTQNCFLLQPYAVQNQPPLLHFIALREVWYHPKLPFPPGGGSSDFIILSWWQNLVRPSQSILNKFSKLWMSGIRSWVSSRTPLASTQLVHLACGVC